MRLRDLYPQMYLVALLCSIRGETLRLNIAYTCCSDIESHSAPWASSRLELQLAVSEPISRASAQVPDSEIMSLKTDVRQLRPELAEEIPAMYQSNYS